MAQRVMKTSFSTRVLAPDVNNADKAVCFVVRSTRYPVPGVRSFRFSSGFATGIFEF